MNRIMTLVAAALLAACGGDAGKATDGDAESQETDARGGVIGEAYIESLEEAEAVEDLALEQKERIDEALEEAEGRD